MDKPPIPSDALASLNRFLPLMENDRQDVLKLRRGLFGCPRLTLSGVAERLKLSIGEVVRLERAAVADLERLFGRRAWL